MYSVFIVDDEVIVREGLRNKIDWNNSQFTLAGEAGDGEIALSMIQEIKPDILITDIRMPFMDGLELSTMVKKMQPWIKIIILSGHDEFEYAKKAISIGVEDYILKPFTSDEILNALNKIAASLDEEKKHFSDINKMKDELESNSLLVKKTFLTDVVMGAISSAEALEKASQLGINLIARFYCITISELRSNKDSTTDLLEAKSRLISFAEKKDDLINFFIAPDKFVCIKKSASQEQFEDDVYNLADSIQHEIIKTTDCSVITAIGSIVDRTALISKSYEEADKILKLCRLGGRNRIVGTNDIKKIADGKAEFIEQDPIIERLKFASASEIDSIIESYQEMIGKNPEHFSVIASYLMLDIIYGVSKLFEELGGNIKEIMPEILTRKFIDETSANEEIFFSNLRNILQQVFEFRNSRMQGRYGDVILRAKKFIEENYSDPDICLHSVAEEVAFSPNHFSTIFSQECGKTFIEYLTTVRIEAAKKLLRTSQMKSADIAYEVGFSDPHYFSFIFKKQTGTTPREYRGGTE